MWSRFSSAVMVGGDEVGADVVQQSSVERRDAMNSRPMVELLAAAGWSSVFNG